MHRRNQRGDGDAVAAVASTNVFVYNRRSEIVGTTLRNGGSFYQYDWQGNRLLSTNGSGSVVYAPDALNQYADAVGYNARTEVVSATVTSNEYAYAYDYIGNHTASSVNSATTTYTANALNQYTAISNLVQSCNPVYDLDGNMLTNGVWSYTWDAENRLIAAYSNSLCVVSNAYDHASRRVLKFTPTATHTFIYDGWNLIQETVQNQQSTITNQYVWGTDLSNTMQGAGGVGGLLAISLNDFWYFPFYDANGNVTAYVDEQGSIVAEYAYDAFGSTISQSDTMSDAFPHRFSTKYFDAETGLYYYGYRFYNPILHRWLNRDPIEENGGVNLYAFCRNDGVNYIDPKGDDFIYIIDSKAVKGQGHAAAISGPVNGKWRYDSFGKPTTNHRHGQYIFKSKKDALAFAVRKQYTHYARWCTDETQDSIAQSQADLWHTGNGSNYKTLREYDIDGDSGRSVTVRHSIVRQPPARITCNMPLRKSHFPNVSGISTTHHLPAMGKAIRRQFIAWTVLAGKRIQLSGWRLKPLLAIICQRFQIIPNESLTPSILTGSPTTATPLMKTAF